MLRSRDDLVLELSVEMVEVITVARDPYDQVPVFLRLPLGSPQGVGIDDVELDVMPIEAEVGPDQAHELLQALTLKHPGGKSLV